jgi:hypothetical protein
MRSPYCLHVSLTVSPFMAYEIASLSVLYIPLHNFLFLMRSVSYQRKLGD